MEKKRRLCPGFLGLREEKEDDDEGDEAEEEEGWNPHF